MTAISADNLSRDKVRQLLNAVGSAPAPQVDQTEAIEYDWARPHVFTTNQTARLEAFVTRVAANAARRFTELCRSSFDVSVSGITEHFAADFTGPTAAQHDDYHLVFAGTDQNVCGFVGIPLQSAMAWAAQLLGDSDLGSDSDRQLSELEESLLSDAAIAFVEAFNESFEDRDFQATTRITRGPAELPFENIDELCKIEIEVKKTGSDTPSNAYLIVRCRQLASGLGFESGPPRNVTAEETSNAILEHVLDMPVCVSTLLASATMKLRQTMSIEPDDVLLLNKRIDRPIDVIVGGLRIMQGWPARSGKQYAVVITNEQC